jgi:ribose 1,5-bisphosphokinase
MTAWRGTLFLVVGPSGAGKDTLIRAVGMACPELFVPDRAVTRAAESGGEIIEPLSPEAFARRESAGGFALSWRAHGLAYGVPMAMAEALAAGRDVLVNVSRGVVDAARARFQPCRVLVVTASHHVLAERLAERGRESVDEIDARLGRAGYALPQGPDVTVIHNDGALEPAVAAFLAALQPVRA